MVTVAEDQQSMSGWCARNDGNAKCVLAWEFPARLRSHDLTASKGWWSSRTGL